MEVSVFARGSFSLVMQLVEGAGGGLALDRRRLRFGGSGRTSFFHEAFLRLTMCFRDIVIRNGMMIGRSAQ